MDNWKQFHGTEIGSYLSKIYGKQANVEYPKIETTKAFQPSKKFSNSGAPEREIKSRTHIKNLVEIPQVVQKKYKPVAAVDLIPKKRSEEVITNEIETIKFQRENYRPAHTRAISSEEEKEKLNQICRYKGGKGLPQDFILPVSKAPFEIEAENKYKNYRNKLNINPSSALPSSSSSENRYTSSTTNKSKLSLEEDLSMQITQEINERITHLQEMKANGIINKYEIQTIENEIRQRTQELKRMMMRSR